MSGPASVELSAEVPPRYARLFAIAERDPRRAQALARRWHARAADQPPFEQAIATYALGYALLRWERLDEADPLLAEAQARLEALGQARLDLHARRALLYLAMQRGGSAHHAADWAALAISYEGLGDPLSAARARLGQMGQLSVQGLAAAALELAAAIRPVLGQLGSPGDQAWLYRITGMAYTNQAALAAALGCFDQAAALFTALGQRAELAKTWFEYSRLCERRGELAQAISYVDCAYQVMKRLDLPLRAAVCLKNLGIFATLRGEYDRGILAMLQAADAFKRLHRPDLLADCDLNLGNVAYYAGLWDLALAAYRRAEMTYAKLGHQRMELISRRNQALALRLRGEPNAALQLLGTLVSFAEQLNERLELAWIRLTQAQAYADLGQLAAAEQAFAQAEAQFRELGNSSAAGESLLDWGWLLLRQGKLEAAEQLLQSALPLLHEQPIYQWRAEHGLGRCAEQRGERSAARERYQRANLMVAQLRQRLANEHASSGLFDQARQLMEDAIRLAWQLGDAALLLDLAELQRSLTLAASLREAQVKAIAQLMPSSAASHRASPNSGTPEGVLDAGQQQELQAYLEQRLRRRRSPPAAASEPLARLDLLGLRQAFQQAFPAGWTLLVYLTCADQLLTVIVEPAQIAIVATAYDVQLQQLLTRASDPRYHALTYVGEGHGTPAWPTLAALGERLIPAQVSGRLHPEQRLLIVASGTLHSLPWAGLRVGGRWLVEQTTPQLLPGLLNWQALSRRQAPGDDALLIGVSQFGERAEALAGVQPTLNSVAARWPGQVTRLEEAAASVEALLDQAGRGELQRYGLIHFATHGRLAPASGLLAELKLADGDLRYDDIVQLGLGGALVVLAACEGAAAEVLPGEELLSLSWAFLAGGARDVIASLWQLYDATAPQLLDLLYEQLSAGHAAPSALALAQRAWLVRYELDALASTPLVWASLSTLGAGTAREGTCRA